MLPTNPVVILSLLQPFIGKMLAGWLAGWLSTSHTIAHSGAAGVRQDCRHAGVAELAGQGPQSQEPHAWPAEQR